MKNKKFKERKHRNVYKRFIEKEISQGIKSLYERLLTKLRFSLVLKLNTMYILKLIRSFFILNLVFIAVTGYYFFHNIDNNIQRNFKVITDKFEGKLEIPTYNLSVISEIDGLTIRIYDENDELKYSSIADESENRSEEYDSKKIKVGKNRFIQPILQNVSDEASTKTTSQNNTQSLRSFNYIFENQFISEIGEFKLQLSYDIYNDLKYLMAVFLVLIVIEFLIILLFIPRGAKVAKKILSPIDVMNDTVKNITINHLDTRLNIGGSQNELKDLSITFNNMLDRIQQSYESQNQFVSDASHELRTPIAVLQGYVRMLDRWGKNDEKVLEESIQAIKSETENMKNLVEKLLFLARGDKNTQQVNKEIFKLNELIEEVYKETKMIDNKHVINLAENVYSEIYADRHLLKEALRVFVDNSIKYTEEGGSVTISSFLNNGKVCIVIGDTGIGISQEDLPKIFDRFYRADKSRTRESGGTGLGLSIAKWIIIKHQGEITVESKLNEGTKIILKLPQS